MYGYWIGTKTNNKENMLYRPRVFFSCHPMDFSDCFRGISKDILKHRDCTIFYEHRVLDLTGRTQEDTWKGVLPYCNLFVVPVTSNLLTKPNHVLDELIPFAIEKRIPLLPLLMEPKSDLEYLQNEQIGMLQYLSPMSLDPTQLNYEDKLKKYLDSVLVSEKTNQLIRNSFSSRIFLSYRKNDRLHANKLMQAIHALPQCRNISIWFDEFLPPGERFDRNIEEALNTCDLFMLVVTPHLLEKTVNAEGMEQDNYILRVELPLALKRKEETGLPIMAVQMESTDPDALAAIGIHSPEDFENPEFLTRLLRMLPAEATNETCTAEQEYLIGLAYLHGIDVEINREYAIEKITASAEAGHLDAMSQLYTMFSNGIAVDRNYEKAAYWAHTLAERTRTNFGEKDTMTLKAFSHLVSAYMDMGKYQMALPLAEKLHSLCCEVMGEEDPRTLYALQQSASIYNSLGKSSKAIELQNTAYSLMCKANGDSHIETLKAMADLAFYLGEANETQQALNLHLKAYKQLSLKLSDNHPLMLKIRSYLVQSFTLNKQYKEAMEWAKILYERQRKELGEEAPQTLTSLHMLAGLHGYLADYPHALELQKQAYQLRCKVLGAEHPHTAVSLHNLGVLYLKSGDYSEALKTLRATYDLQCKALGQEHPYAMCALDYIATVCDRLDNHNEAKHWKEWIYQRRCQVQGQKHPQTIHSMISLAHTHYCLYDYPQAIAYLQEAYFLQMEVLGPDHPQTIQTRVYIGQVFQNFTGLSGLF